MYQALQPLQGSYVPRLLGYGSCDGWQFFVVRGWQHWGNSTEVTLFSMLGTAWSTYVGQNHEPRIATELSGKWHEAFWDVQSCLHSEFPPCLRPRAWRVHR